MKKILTALIGASAAATIIYLSRYGYIFNAAILNLKKGPLTPSIDDEEKFPSRTIDTLNPKSWQKDTTYNNKKLSEFLLNDLKRTRASSILVIQNGKLIYEQYWNEHNLSSLMNSFSMAKGILALLVGFAIEDGYLRSEDDAISSVFPKYKSSRYGKYLTFRHLMTMQAGLDWEEEYNHPFSPNSKQYFIPDLAKQAFSVKVKKMPGKKYEYQSVAAQLLGLALRKVTGQELTSYLSEKLWQPLGMEFSAKWGTDEKGIEKSFCCIHATPRDFAKIGQLIMNKGTWNGKQLISAEFCKRFLTPTETNDAFCYTVWANDQTVPRYRFFYGFLGQFIIMVPERNMVIVKTGFYNRLEVDKKQRPIQVKLLIEEFI